MAARRLVPIDTDDLVDIRTQTGEEKSRSERRTAPAGGERWGKCNRKFTQAFNRWWLRRVPTRRHAGEISMDGGPTGTYT